MHSDLLLLQASSLSSSNHHLIPALGSGKEELTLQSPYFTHQFLPFLKLWFQPKSAMEFLLLKDPNNHLNLKSNSVFSDIFSLTVKQQKTVSFFHGLSLPNVRLSRFSWFANCSSRLFHINTLAQKFLTLELVLLTITNSSTSTLHHRCSFIRLSFCFLHLSLPWTPGTLYLTVYSTVISIPIVSPWPDPILFAGAKLQSS